MAKQPPLDSQLEEIIALTDGPVTIPELANSVNLLALVPSRLISPEAPPHDRARELYKVFRRVLDEAVQTIRENSTAERACSIMAAGCLMGLTRLEPNDLSVLPSAERNFLDEVAPSRQARAGRWVGVGDRSARKRENRVKYCEHFRNALLDYLERYSDKREVSGQEANTELPSTTPQTLPVAEVEPEKPEPVEHEKRQPKPALVAGAVLGGVALLGLGTWGVVSLLDGDSNTGNGGGQTQSPGVVASSERLTFDGLGGGSSIIEVYRGPADSARDKQANGTFNAGDTAAAVCKTKGRSVSSNPQLGEQPRTSDDWIRIHGTPGQEQYATAVYVKDPDALLVKLSNC